MMRDAKGRELKAGDLLLIPVRLMELYPDNGHCDASARSVFGRRPDGSGETIYVINAGITLRANPGDENDPADWPTT